MTGLNHRHFLNAALFVASGLFTVAPVSAQQMATGQTATSSVGQVGRRQSQVLNVKPVARLNNRIQNRVQSRIRSRIDRDYSAPSDTLSSFTSAAAQARTTAQTAGK